MSEANEDEIVKMSVAEFRRLGYLAELNRRFLHPLGLALEVVIEDDGSEHFGGVWDYRDDPEGMNYGAITAEMISNAGRISEEWAEKSRSRHIGLGYTVQPIPGECSRCKQPVKPGTVHVPFNGNQMFACAVQPTREEAMDPEQPLQGFGEVTVFQVPPLTREQFPDDETFRKALESSGKRDNAVAEPGEVDISGIEAEVLAALFNAAAPIGMGYLQYKADHVMTTEEAAALLAEAGQRPVFDYLEGRSVKLKPFTSPLQTDLYNRDNGSGRAEAIVARVREELGG